MDRERAGPGGTGRCGRCPQPCPPPPPPRSRGDLCKAPSARAGLFLSLAALTLTFLAVPLAPALLANPFYRRLNIAQAAKQNLLGTATWGFGSAAAATPGRGGHQHRGDTATSSLVASVTPRCLGAIQVTADAPGGFRSLLPALERQLCSQPGFPAVLPHIWSIWSSLGALILEKHGGRAGLAAVPDKEQPSGSGGPRGAGSEPQICVGLSCTPQRLCRARGWAQPPLSKRDVCAESMNSLSRH